MTRPVQTFRIEEVAETPWPLEPGVLYLLRARGHGNFICPCGCGYMTGIHVNPGGWTLDEKTVTVAPSVLTQPCGAHFFIRNGEVVWC